MTHICFVLIPTEASRGLHPLSHCCNIILAFIAHYCNSLTQIYALTFLTIFEVNFGFYIAYDRHFGLQEVIMNAAYTIMTLLVLATLSATFEQISSLYIRLEFMNSENIKLLNGMHEGLLILSKPEIFDSDREEMFCNKSALKVL